MAARSKPTKKAASTEEVEVDDEVVEDVVDADADGEEEIDPDLLDELEDDPNLSSIPVMIVTGTVDAVPALRERIGDENVIIKPFGVDALLNRVKELIGEPA